MAATNIKIPTATGTTIGTTLTSHPASSLSNVIQLIRTLIISVCISQSVFARQYHVCIAYTKNERQIEAVTHE